MKKSKKQFVANYSGPENTGSARSPKSTIPSSPLRGLFGSGYTITEDVLM